MNTNWALALVIELLLVGQAWFGTVRFRSWLAPGAFWATMWAAFVAMSLIFAPDYKIWPGVVWFFLMNGMLLMGAALSGGSAKRPARHLRRRQPSIRALRWGILICAVLGMLGVEILLRSAGEGLLSLANPEAVALTGLVFSTLRYGVLRYREPSSYITLTVLIYLGGSLSGVLFGLSRRRLDRLISWVILVPALLIGISLTTRAPILLVGINWVSAYLATGIWNSERGWRLRLGLGTATRVSVIAAGLVVVYVGLAALRGGATLRVRARANGEVQFGLSNAKAAYIGSMAAFSGWFGRSWDTVPTPTLGERTFASAYQWLYPNKPFGRFDEEQVSPDPDAPTTNVCTIYRVLGEDFTLPGSALLILLLGIFGGWAYESVRQGAFHHIPYLAVYYEIAFVSLTGFGMRDTTLQAAFLLFVFFVRLGQREGPAAARRAQPMAGRAMPEAV
jgi:oligosaccharide repeat unit polymerase